MAFSIGLENLGAFGVPMVYKKSDDSFHMSFVVRVETAVRGSVEDPMGGGYLVGYSPICTHMGCYLVRGADDHNVVYNANEHEQLTCGPCPCHGTTFDLLKQGLVVLGPATQNLAQLKLQLSIDKTKVEADSWIKHPDPRDENWPYSPSNTEELHNV